MYQLRLYTRAATNLCLDGRAHSIYMSLLTTSVKEKPLNRNYGLLFATVEIDENDCMVPRFLFESCIAKTDAGTTVDHQYDRCLRKDFCRFEPLGMTGKAILAEGAEGVWTIPEWRD